VSDGEKAMPEVTEGSGNAEVLLVGTFGRLKINAGDYMSLQQCRNLAKSDAQAVEIQCRELEKASVMQKSC